MLGIDAGHFFRVIVDGAIRNHNERRFAVVEYFRAVTKFPAVMRGHEDVDMGFLERENGRYQNTPATDLFLDQGKDSYIGGILEMANLRLYPFWHHLTEALRTGQPQNEAKHGGDFFAVLYADPQRLAGFLSAMSGLSRATNIA